MPSSSDAFDSVEQLSPNIGEFPRIDERYLSRPYRHGWMLVMDREMPVDSGGARASGFRMNRIGHIDHQTGKEDSWWAGPRA